LIESLRPVTACECRTQSECRSALRCSLSPSLQLSFSIRRNNMVSTVDLVLTYFLPLFRYVTALKLPSLTAKRSSLTPLSLRRQSFRPLSSNLRLLSQVQPQKSTSLFQPFHRIPQHPLRHLGSLHTLLFLCDAFIGFRYWLLASSSPTLHRCRSPHWRNRQSWIHDSSNADGRGWNASEVRQYDAAKSIGLDKGVGHSSSWKSLRTLCKSVLVSTLMLDEQPDLFNPLAVA